MLGHYLRVAYRSALRTPLATAINILALTLGLTCFVIAFATVGYWDNAESAFPNASRTYVITTQRALKTAQIATNAAPTTGDFVAKYIRADFPDLDAVARAGYGGDVSVKAGDRKMRLQVTYADPELLRIFDLPFIKGGGRDALRTPLSVVLTREGAMRLYDTTDVVGRPLLVSNDIMATVTGVVGEIPQPSHIGRSATAVLRFDVLASWDIIEKLQEIARTTLRGPNTPPPPEYWLNQDCCTTYAMLPANGRLDADRFKTGLATFAERHAPKQQLSGATLEFGAAPVKSLMTDGLNKVLFSGGDAGVSITTILLLLGALVLVVAGLNYANLAAARTAARASEVGIRKVVGASRGQVMIQYLLEAGMMTAVSLVLALVIVEILSPVIRASTDVDPSFVLFSGLEFWAFVIALLIVVSLAAGAYPAFVLSRVRPVQALRGTKSRTGSRFLSALFVGVQFATAGFLLIAVIVMYQQNRDLTKTALGANQDPVVEIPNVPFFTHVNPRSFRDQLLAMPGIKSISSVGDIPWTANVSLIPFRRSQTAASAPRNAYQNIVDYDFFKTLGMTVIAGRVFDREHGGDLLPQGNQPLDPAHPLTLVIDRAYAKALGFALPAAAVGKMVYLVPQTEKDTPQPARIIGVVENKPLHLLGDGVTSNAYLLGGNQYYVLVRLSRDNVAAGVKAIHEVWDRQAPNIATTVSFMDTLFGQSYETFNRINTVFNGLALLTLVISAMGLFGMAIQATGRRIKEIGIRKSLGASTGQVLRLLVTDFSKPVVIANLIAWPVAFYAAERYLSIFIQRVPLTPTPFVLSLAITLVIAWVAVGVHALRAARIKPAQVLRYE